MHHTEKKLQFFVAVTDKCNRKCRHCSVCAASGGSNFVRAMWVRKLVREAKQAGYVIYGSLSGLGEPLMHPKIVKIAEAFVGLKICRGISFTTSGFLAGDSEEKERFRKLICTYFRDILRINLSFNLYSPSFPQRLEETLGMLFTQRRMSFTNIRIACDRTNYFKTLEGFVDVLNLMEVKLGMKMWPVAMDRSDNVYKDMIGKFLEREYNEEKELQLLGDALYIPYICGAENRKYGKKYFRLDPFMISPLGHAKNFPAACFSQQVLRCKDVLLEGAGKADSLHMGPDGRIYPACKCMLGGLSIGNWETPLLELLERKRMLRKNLLRMVMAETSVEWRCFPCVECAALAKRNFSFVG